MPIGGGVGIICQECLTSRLQSSSLDAMKQGSDFQEVDILSALREENEKRQDALGEAHRIDERIASLVEAAREYGVSWQNIGAALGTSRQSAWERFGELDKRMGRAPKSHQTHEGGKQ
jgi:hypothetical protein